MRAAPAGRALSGLAAGALLSAALLGAVVVGAMAGLPNVAFVLFEWVVRVLPGRLAGLACGVAALAVVWLQAAPAGVTASVLAAVWVGGLFTLWGWAAARIFVWLYPSGARAPAGGAAAAPGAADDASRHAARAAVPASASPTPSSPTPASPPPAATAPGGDLEAVRLDRRHLLIRAAAEAQPYPRGASGIDSTSATLLPI